ncbi:hypothetical protein B0T21DRAFT_401817 [Apiosordaria backusii]|uniref:Zn(2)-C6 fungal-type domain-containing protein n=1 Tax=Apiosordaria backusii TaxID=314023 RepID=A0AA40BLE5_9PEZI|nr:hypothetical protein B0T21DRAFT_401817 [Apiosordaria backusii]
MSSTGLAPVKSGSIVKAKRVSVVGDTGFRKRKAHTKSRRGCINCKLRHIKCDELKPICNNCTTFRVSCTYDRALKSSEALALQPWSEQVFPLAEPKETYLINVSLASLSLNRQVLTMLNDHLRQSDPQAAKNGFLFKGQDLKILNQFHERTILSLKMNQKLDLYRRESVRLAIQEPFLFHLVLTITLMHERIASSPLIPTPPSVQELYHYAIGSSQLNKLLYSPPSKLTRVQKDAMFIGTILLSCTSFAQIDPSLPLTSHWPFVSSPHDLDWLKICTGKREVQKLADTHAADSSLRDISTEFLLFGPNARVNLLSEQEAIAQLPESLRRLLRLDHEGVSAKTNAYYDAGVVVGRILPLEVSEDNLLVCLVLVSFLPVRFREMLEEKDPKALLLFAWYHAKIGQFGRWWIWRRAMVEGRAIVAYLERYYGGLVGGDEELLGYPKKWCGMDVMVNEGVI